MSRAFVKEDAEPVPVEWRRGLKTTAGLPLTLSGANRLKAELKRLESAGPAASPPGSETAQRIAQLVEVLANSEIVDARKLSGAQVTFGATVVLLDVDGGAQTRYRIVGEIEADRAAGRISVTSPLARALIGREVGDLVEVQAPGGAREVELRELLWIEEEGT